VVRRVAVDAAYVVLPVEGIRAVEVTWTGSMAGEAAFVYHLRGCVFRFEVKNQLLRLGIFRIGALRFQFCVGVGFARTVTPIATGAGTRFVYPLRDLIVRARVDGFHNVLTRFLVAMKTSLSSCQRARIGLGGRLPGNGRAYCCGRLLLGESNTGSQLQQGQSQQPNPPAELLRILCHWLTHFLHSGLPLIPAIYQQDPTKARYLHDKLYASS